METALAIFRDVLQKKMKIDSAKKKYQAIFGDGIYFPENQPIVHLSSPDFFATIIQHPLRVTEPIIQIYPYPIFSKRHRTDDLYLERAMKLSRPEVVETKKGSIFLIDWSEQLNLKEIHLQPGDFIQLKTGEKKETFTSTDAEFRIVSSPDYDLKLKPKSHQKIFFTQPGKYYFISRYHPKRIRLILNLSVIKRHLKDGSSF